MDEEQRKELFEEFLPKAEQMERDRGLTEEQIAANRQKLTRFMRSRRNSGV